ncbi:hypothetical protein HY994_06340 [Candidatus Micrarchaeota archaeon]|nr:hypothetical protein [Candidatus Micrarchaeota archaeon]
MAPFEQRVKHTPLVLFASGEYGSGKSTSLKMAAKLLEKRTGSAPRIFRIDDYGGHLRNWIDYDGHNPYPDWFKQSRYDLMSRDIADHLQNHPEQDVLVDSPLHAYFEPIVRHVIDNPRFFAYKFRMVSDRPLQLARIESNTDRSASMISGNLLRKKPAMWDVPITSFDREKKPDTFIENRGSKKELEKNIGVMVDRLIEETTAPKASPQDVNRQLQKIKRKYKTPNARLKALLLYLQDRYRFNRLGSAQLFQLQHDPVNPGEIKLVPTVSRTFFSDQKPHDDELADSLPLTDTHLLARTWRNHVPYHFSADSPLKWYHVFTELEKKEKIPHADEFQYPVGRFSEITPDPLAAPLPGPEALFVLSSINKRNPELLSELNRFLNHPSVRQWATAAWNEQDKSSAKVHGAAKKIETLEGKTEKMQGFSKTVAVLSAALARKLGYAPDEVKQVYWGGLLHRMGLLSMVHPEANQVTPAELNAGSRLSNSVLDQLPHDHPIVLAATQHQHPDCPPVPVYSDHAGQRRVLSSVGFLEQYPKTKSQSQSLNHHLRELYDDPQGFSELMQSDRGDLSEDMVDAIGNHLASLDAQTFNPGQVHDFAKIVRVASAFCHAARSGSLQNALSSIHSGAKDGRFSPKIADTLDGLSQTTLRRILSVSQRRGKPQGRGTV